MQDPSDEMFTKCKKFHFVIAQLNNRIKFVIPDWFLPSIEFLSLEFEIKASKSSQMLKNSEKKVSSMTRCRVNDSLYHFNLHSILHGNFHSDKRKRNLD